MTTWQDLLRTANEREAGSSVRGSGRGKRRSRPAPSNLKDAAIYFYIGAFRKKHGYPPTYEEIRQECGLSSKSIVAYHLERLRLASYVDYKRYRSGSLTVVTGPAL